MSHRAPDTETVAQKPPLRDRIFVQANMPHFAMGFITLLWLYFQVTLGTAGVPGPIQQGFAAILGLWSSYVFSLVAKAKADK